VNDIPSLPQFVIETLKKLDDPKSSAADVANKLSRDEGLVIRVLRLANSAYYGLSRRISSVSEAISFLGFKTVKSIVLAASVYKFMDSSFTGYALDRAICGSTHRALLRRLVFLRPTLRAWILRKRILPEWFMILGKLY
jgi:Predicted signal transduction protein